MASRSSTGFHSEAYGRQTFHVVFTAQALPEHACGSRASRGEALQLIARRRILRPRTSQHRRNHALSLGSARSAGRGAAAAYAYRTGDAQALRDLGLDYDALRANPNVFDVVHQIAQKACEDLPPGTIDTAEQMEVVGRLAEWLVESDIAGAQVSLGQIAEAAVALILAEAYLVETSSTLNTKGMTGAQRAELEDGVRQAAEELAAHANLTPAGPSPDEFTRAIEDGLEYLRAIYEGD